MTFIKCQVQKRRQKKLLGFVLTRYLQLSEMFEFSYNLGISILQLVELIWPFHDAEEKATTKFALIKNELFSFYAT